MATVIHSLHQVTGGQQGFRGHAVGVLHDGPRKQPGASALVSMFHLAGPRYPLTRPEARASWQLPTWKPARVNVHHNGLCRLCHYFWSKRQSALRDTLSTVTQGMLSMKQPE